MIRFLLCSALLLGCAQQTLWAQEPNVPGTGEKQFQGSVVSVDANKLVTADGGGAENIYMVDSGTTVMIDNKPAQLLDLKKGDKVTVTTGPEGKVLTIICQRTTNLSPS